MALTVEQLFPKLAPLLKAYAAKYPEDNGFGIPSLDVLQSVRCSKADCMKPKKNYMDPLPCAWCEEHMPSVVDLTTTPPPKKPAAASEFKEPLPTLVGSKELHDERAQHPSIRPKKNPVKRRLTYEDDYGHDMNTVFFRTVHARYQKDLRWLRTAPPDNHTISNNLKAIEVHLQQLKDQFDTTEDNVLHKVAVIGERQDALEENMKQMVDSINRIDESIDDIQANITDICKLVNDFLEKQK